MDAFADGLSDLGAHPDRAKIEALTMLAEDAAGDADVVRAYAETALGALVSAPPAHKLTLLYVIDSISKSRIVGAEFQAATSSRISDVVVGTWHQVRRGVIRGWHCSWSFYAHETKLNNLCKSDPNV